MDIVRGRAAWAMLAVSACLALLYGAFSHNWYESGRWLELLAAFKASSIVVLAALAVMARAPRLIVWGLLFGAVGDAFLALNNADSLISGAAAFVVGHVSYIRAFHGAGIGVRSAIKRLVRLFAMLALGAFAIWSTMQILPSGSELARPLTIYTAVLTVMVMASFTLPAARWPTIAGAMLFFVSDGFVALNLFHPNPDASVAFWLNFVGWMIYWIAQAAICVGMSGAAERTR